MCSIIITIVADGFRKWTVNNDQHSLIPKRLKRSNASIPQNGILYIAVPKTSRQFKRTSNR